MVLNIFKNRQWSEALPYALLALAIFLTYANAWTGDFVLDDVWAVEQNSFLRHWSTLPDALTTLTFAGAGQPGGFHRPLLAFFWFLTNQAFGLSTAAFHGLNILLHVINVLLVCRLGRVIGLRPCVSFAAALLWAVHPLHTEAVTYISGLGDLLYTTLCLSGLLILLPGFTWRKILLSGAFFIFALAAKESAAVFPALVVITLFFFGSRSTAVRTWPLWVISGIYLAGLFAFIHSSGFSIKDHGDADWMAIYGGNVINRIITALATVPFYLALLIWPFDLHLNRTFQIFDDPLSWQVLTGAGIVLAAASQLLWGRGKRGIGLSWGLLWFAIAYSPNTGVIYPVDALMFEHWMYMPTIGLVLGIAHSLPNRMPRMAIIPVVLLAILLGLRAFDQNKVWQDGGTLIENGIRYSDHNEIARNSLGVFYTTRNEFDKAIEQFNIVLATPENIPPAMLPAVHMNLALAYLGINFNHDPNKSVGERIQAQYETIRNAILRAPHRVKGIAELEKVIELDPQNYWANGMLAMLYAQQGDMEKATQYQKQTEPNP